MKSRALTVLLSVLLFPAFSGAAHAQAPTVDQVVDRYLVAMGGRDAVGKLTNRKATGTITVGTPAGDLSGPAEIYSKAPNKTRSVIRLDLSAVGAAGDVVVEQLFDGNSGWSLNSMQGDSPLAGRQLENMRNGVFPSPLLAYKEAGIQLEVLTAEKAGTRDAIVLRLTPKSGAPIKLYFDADTHLIIRTVSLADNPMGGGDLEQTSDVSDYRAVDGVKVPFLIVNSNKLQTAKITLSTVEHNIAIDDAMFVKK